MCRGLAAYHDVRHMRRLGKGYECEKTKIKIRITKMYDVETKVSTHQPP
jgi:hypothetical protein